MLAINLFSWKSNTSSFFSFLFNNAYQDLGSLFFYAISVSLYAVVIWHFYRHLGKRAIFKVDLNEPKILSFLHRFWGFVQFLVRSLVIFPIITTLWFLVLGGFLLVLSKSQNIEQILLMSMTVITAARITAYYNEDLAKDVAKLVPFALLGVFIVDPTYFSIDIVIQKINSLPGYFYLIIQYIFALVTLEFILRSLYRIKLLTKKISSENKKPDRE
ncbi:MAG: hypothetical protein KKF44_11460 [Nanoarchaeota archaeon]|nr:hypothetical protein [Nanoarchaeota archaeon]